MRADQFNYFNRPFAALAHRGGSLIPENLGLENTLHAFSVAVKLGFQYLETDVHATADGQLVTFHDHDLNRLCGQPGLIAELPWQRVRQIRIGGVEPIPLLDEVLSAFPETYINIDLKHPKAIEPLAQTIARHNAWDRVCVASFSNRNLQRFRRLISRPVAMATAPLTIGLTSFFPSLASWLRDPAVVYQMPLTYRALNKDWKLFSSQILSVVHKLGKRVHIWTIDNAEIMNQLLDLGVDGIVTDRPDILKSVMQARGIWSD